MLGINGDSMKLSSYTEILGENDVAFAVKTDGRRFSFVEGGDSSTGVWSVGSSSKFNKVIVFNSGKNSEVYIGDFISMTEAGEKYYINFTNSKLAGVSTVNWTAFTGGKAPGYSRIYLSGVGIVIDPPAGKVNPQRKTVTIEVIERDQQVKSWILKQSKGICENCHCVAPFTSDDQTPYLEVHHVKRLADGGTDTVQNAVALCPNCHKELHFGNKRDKLKSHLYKAVTRLIRE